MQPTPPLKKVKNNSIKGVGLSARPSHFSQLLKNPKAISWLEILADNFLDPHSPSRSFLEKLSLQYPLVFHCVNMSLGSLEKPDLPYFRSLKSLVEEFRPTWISDHLCWTQFQGYYLQDLIPFPLNQKYLNIVCDKVKFVQDFFGLPFLVENVSSYVGFKESDWTEEKFLSELIKKTGCFLLFDVNNIYVNSYNHGFCAETVLKNLPEACIKQVHLAGYQDCGNYYIDTHGENVHRGVWDLYKKFLKIHGCVATNIERDENIPPFEEIYKEVQKAEAIFQNAKSKLKGNKSYVQI